MNQYEYILAARYEHDDTSGDWCAVICKQVRDTPQVMEVVACGVEHSEELILVWLRDTIALMRRMGRVDVSIPDALERAQSGPKH